MNKKKKDKLEFISQKRSEVFENFDEVFKDFDRIFRSFDEVFKLRKGQK